MERGGRNDTGTEALAARFGGVPVHGCRALFERSDVDAVYPPLSPGLTTEMIDYVAESIIEFAHQPSLPRPAGG